MVSVIIPTYNYAQYILFAIESVKAQSFKDWEIIIVDDGSTDDTRKIIETNCSSDKRITYIYKVNSGVSHTRNVGIEKAKGEFIQFLDADDLLDPYKFENQVKVFINQPEVDIVYGRYQLMNSFGTERYDHAGTDVILQDDVVRHLLLGWENGLLIPIHSFLFRKSCFTNLGYFDTQFKTHEDLLHYLMLAAERACFYYQPDLVAFYRIHASSVARKYSFNDYFLVLVTFGRRYTEYKSTVLNRYFRELARLMALKLTGKDVSISQSLKSTPYGYNFFGMLLSPFYICRKLIHKLIR